jgi:hypothetical protein
MPHAPVTQTPPKNRRWTQVLELFWPYDLIIQLL